MSPADVIAFWRKAGPDRWFDKDEGFDRRCREEFESAWEDARAGRLDGWADTPEGALALVLLLDQMPRNMWRGTARVYESDPQARAAADRAIARGFDRAVPDDLRTFFYLPFMHSEALADQERCVALYAPLGEEASKWARHHYEMVARFGRFPHRNAILGRASTPEEEAWLADPEAFKG